MTERAPEPGGQNAQIIVQAGGRGSRLRHHTWNKPKCLVSVDGKPILHHLLRLHPDARHVIIGDYQVETLETYLQIEPPKCEYHLLRAEGEGTASGMRAAVDVLDRDQPVKVFWGDLRFSGPLPPASAERPTIYVTSEFICRWTVSDDGVLQEKPGARRGVMGAFHFPQASQLEDAPVSGEFVRWLSETRQEFDVVEVTGASELGDFATIEAANDRLGFSRFFNKVEVGEETVKKTVVDPDYEQVHANEIAWYRAAQELGFRRIPKIHSHAPLVMERIRGRHAFEFDDLTTREKGALLADMIDALFDLHGRDTQPADPSALSAVYVDKTVDRVQQVKQLIPNLDRASITVNGKKCPNLFHSDPRAALRELEPWLATDRFTPIHGDPTFSNAMVDDRLRTIFIDPRGAFRDPGIFGDPWYDFGKVYYSALGGYDGFNRRRFKLIVDATTAEIMMEDTGFEDTATAMMREYFPKDVGRIGLLHGLIWLSLAGYARDDVDSVIAAFCLGLYWTAVGTEQL